MSEISLFEAISGRRSHRAFGDQAVSSTALHNMLWAAQGQTDEIGNRTAPSAHALHPLRLLVTIGNVEGMTDGVYMANSDAKSLTQVMDHDVRGELERAALDDQPWIGRAAGIITICADLASPTRAFADQPPFGARGLRYVYIEAGAAAQNVHLQAVSEGLGCVLVAGFRDEETADVLNIKAPIAPILHLCFGWPA